MRNFLYLLLVLSGNAGAGCTDLFTYQDSKIFIMISEYDCGGVIATAPIVNSQIQDNLLKELKFDKECKIDFSKKPVYLECRLNIENPLSGATYRRIQKGHYPCANPEGGGPWPAFVYRCIKGCKDVPNEIPETQSCD